ncbi:tetratricopeptide repeat protein 39, partial [Phenoliferia sp. Uapishka_3]
MGLLRSASKFVSAASKDKSKESRSGSPAMVANSKGSPGGSPSLSSSASNAPSLVTPASNNPNDATAQSSTVSASAQAQPSSTSSTSLPLGRNKERGPSKPKTGASSRGADSDSDSETFEDAESGGEEEEGAWGNQTGAKEPVKQQSRVATLAAEAMDAPFVPRQRLGKPLHSLSPDDVKITEQDLREDVSIVWKAMHLFMNSRMIEAEQICLQGADHRLYYSGIIYAGDFMTFLKEALSMRSATAIYKTLSKFVETADLEYSEGEDPSIDQDFRSGVYLGNGSIAVILSLLPSSVLKVMEIFGLNGDLDYGLSTLMKPGQWRAGEAEPGVDVSKEGLRRPFELAYFLNCLGMAPRFVLFDTHLDQVSCVIADLLLVKDPKSYGAGDEYWDDFCLAHLLRGIILRFIVHPEPYVELRPAESQIPISEADEQALVSFNTVLEHATSISHDHHVVWFCHYELGRLYESKGDYAKAREEFELVMSGKMEGGKPKGKGKVSLQNMAVLRSNSALSSLKGK